VVATQRRRRFVLFYQVPEDTHGHAARAPSRRHSTRHSQCHSSRVAAAAAAGAAAARGCAVVEAAKASATTNHTILTAKSSTMIRPGLATRRKYPSSTLSSGVERATTTRRIPKPSVQWPLAEPQNLPTHSKTHPLALATPLIKQWPLALYSHSVPPCLDIYRRAG
jgi:hypothetical protein